MTAHVDFGRLPRDLVLHVLRYCDIDTRRALGVHPKLDVPTRVSDALAWVHRERPLVKVEHEGFGVAAVTYLGPRRGPYSAYAVMALHDVTGLVSFDVIHRPPCNGDRKHPEHLEHCRPVDLLHTSVDRISWKTEPYTHRH